MLAYRAGYSEGIIENCRCDGVEHNNCRCYDGTGDMAGNVNDIAAIARQYPEAGFTGCGLHAVGHTLKLWG